jgi:nucleoside-diphosphate-sugar epimerase
MNVLITGGDGFIGRALAVSLCNDLRFRDTLRKLTIVGLEFDGLPPDPRAQHLVGSIADGAALDRALASPPDLVFHLAAVTSGQAEKEFGLGLRVNVGGTIALFEALRQQQRNPTVVFPSTIAVFGPPYPDVVDDGTWPVPALSYGAEKLMGEILLADYTRRGWLQGRSVRLPSIVARPPIRTGAASAFSSELIRELSSGRTYTCPVSPNATHWLMSRPCCIENLLHASQLQSTLFGPRFVLTLPAVRVSTRELVEAIAQRCGNGVLSRVRYAPDRSLEANFGSFPPLSTPLADAARFRSDGNVETLLKHALATLAEHAAL